MPDPILPGANAPSPLAPASWGAEERLLVAAAAPGDERASRVAAAARGVRDWPRARALAAAHGVLPVLADALGPPGTPSPAGAAVPDDVREGLHDALRRNTWRNVWLTGELLRVLERLAEGGVRALPYKGPALAAELYGNVALRQFGDLDVLVRRRDVRRATELLLGAGYTHQAAWSRVQEFNHETNLVLTEGGIRLDVHGEIFPQSVLPLDPGGVWSRLTTAQVGGRTVPALAREDLLLILSVHADTHEWERLAWIGDIARVARSPGLDWDGLLARARASGSARIVRVALLLSSGLLGVSLPDRVAAFADDDAVARDLAQLAAKRLFRDPAESVAAGDLARGSFQVRSRERLRDRLRMLLTPNEGDWEWIGLPRPLYFLYYLLRPGRLVLKYGAGRGRGR